jgi:DHA1 family multidrug resistance protein-like MFS transporter
MTVSDLIRDTAFGQAVQWVSQKRLLQYPEEKSDFRLPEAWLQVVNEDSDAGRSTRHEFLDSQTQHFTGSSSNSDEENQMEKVETLAMSPSHRDLKRPDLQLQRTKTREETIPYTQDRLIADEQHEIEKNKSIPTVPRKTSDGAILVDWYYTDDPENPQNWSTIRRVMVTAVISLYTFVVYMSSAIYTTSEEGVMEEFGVGQTKASLGLSLFVLG